MRKTLHIEEFNAVAKLLMHTNLDAEFDIRHNDVEGDYFIDNDTGEKADLATGLSWLYDGLAYPLAHERMTSNESQLIVMLFIEFKVVKDQEHIKQLLLREEE